MQAEAIRADHPGHDFTRRRIKQLNDEVRRELERERERGRLRDDLDLDIAARQITALARELQAQWLYNPTIDMGAHLKAFLHTLRR